MKNKTNYLAGFVLAFFIYCCTLSAQNTFPSSGAAGIGTTTPNASSLLEVKSTTKGVLFPRMTQSQRNAIASPVEGLLIYQTDHTAGFYYYNGSAWLAVTTKKGWSLTGNSGTDPSTDFVGTTDAQPLVFKVNNTEAGYLDYNSSLGNTGFGYQTLVANTGASNSAFGYQANFSTTTGSQNTANGYKALYSTTTAFYDAAFGAYALYSNTTGAQNTGTGAYALSANTTGAFNTATGGSALGLNTTGNNNTATGFSALIANTTGSSNSGNGNKALFSNTTGSNNSADGFDALYSNTTGNNNTAHGYLAGNYNTTGSNNTGIGQKALYDNTTGSNNTFVGASTGIGAQTGSNNIVLGYNSTVSNGVNNTTVIGTGLSATTSNTIILGSLQNVGIGTFAPSEELSVYAGAFNPITAIKGFDDNANGNGIIGEADNGIVPYGVWGISGIGSTDYAGYFSGNVHYTGLLTGPSDERLKENIKPLSSALTLVNQLMPRSYNFRSEYDWMHLAKGKQYGFIAQDVEKVLPELVVAAADKSKDMQHPFEYKALNYIGFIPVLTAAMQELSQKNDDLQKQNDDLQGRVAKLESMVSQLTSGSSLLQNESRSSQSSSASAALQQNIPNPFDRTTIIPFTIPQRYSSAAIIITESSTGQTVKTIPVSCSDMQVKIDASQFSGGNYSYSLIVDGKVIDTREMTLTK